NIVGKMHIDGIFEGTISSLDAISIGKRGEVHGNIRAHTIDVCGLLQGEVCCDELTVESGGRVRGSIYCDQMVVHNKGCFVGERHLKEVAADPTLIESEQTPSEKLLKTLDDLPDRISLQSTDGEKDDSKSPNE
ncbi:MAG: polymer-forming cytoskeletal protein, partial [Motiliproteus sp.]|nr:polymer-forming cytoskeletal protein [Motiliproteus sp.]